MGCSGCPISRVLCEKWGLSGVHNRLHITQVRRLPQRHQRIAGRHEFMRHITLEARVGDGPHHAVPLNFLRAVEFMAPRNASGMKVPDPLQVLRGWSR